MERDGEAVFKALISLLWLPLCATAGALQGPSAAVDQCLTAAAAKHGVAYALLRSIAEQESHFNPRAVNSNVDGSADWGLMQINSSWLPFLKKYGITQDQLFQPCINADVGAWILADSFKRLGVTWNAVGAYNAKTPSKRYTYANRVYQKLQRYWGLEKQRFRDTQSYETADLAPSVGPAMGIWEASALAEADAPR